MKRKRLPKNVKVEVDKLHLIVDASQVNKDELLELIPKCEISIAAFRALAASPRLATNRDAQEAIKQEMVEAEADIAAIRRVVKIIEKTAPPSAAAANLPKPVGELVRQYLTTHLNPFTVKQAAEALKAIQPDVTASAVAQALNRMSNGLVRVVQKGVGPNPTYYQRAETDGRISNEENKISDVLNGPNGLGKTEFEISEETTLPVPKVGEVLRRRPEMFSQGGDMKWRKSN
jgi:hypothetical protein